MNRCVCIHGHFYQPPRESPWLEEVEFQDSAYPYHDWNARITAECYAPNTASRIVDAENRILNLINNYAMISFNIGPTLCSWMERHKPEVLAAIIEADRLSQKRFSGHGSAIAQVYNHMIMPLATRKDKYTQAYWGIVDFERRFKRYPEGMWLPETAVDLETLEVLADLRIKFTILAPRQAKRVRALASGAEWQSCNDGINPRIPYLCILPSGRSIVVFFYDGQLSQETAFGTLLDSGSDFAARLASAFDNDATDPQLVSVATDGESYGHHHRHGDMALSFCLHTLDTMEGVRITNYAEFLSRRDPTHQVEIHENSSWSCVHGVERWKSDCGCHAGHPGWHQRWRGPLRRAFDFLRDELSAQYDVEMKRFCTDPWNARNDYIQVAAMRTPHGAEAFLARHVVRDLSHEEKIRFWRLCELARHLMLMYTSCGWFFDDISGIETTQVMRYASRAIQLARELFGGSAEEHFLHILRQAPSNVLNNGATVYERYVLPARLDLQRIGAHYAIYSLFTDHHIHSERYCYAVHSETYQTMQSGNLRLAVGLVRIESTLTWESDRFSFAVLHLGDHNVAGGIRRYGGEDAFAAMQKEITTEFSRGHITEIMQSMLTHFTNNNYSLWHLFRDEQRAVLADITRSAMVDLSILLHQTYYRNLPAMQFMHSVNLPIPHMLQRVAALVLHDELKALLTDDEPVVPQLENLIDQIGTLGIDIKTEELALAASGCVNRLISKFALDSQNRTLMERIQQVLTSLLKLQIDLDVWEAQNQYFAVTKEHFPAVQARAARGDVRAQDWVKGFASLGTLLHVRID